MYQRHYRMVLKKALPKMYCFKMKCPSTALGRTVCIVLDGHLGGCLGKAHHQLQQKLFI